MSIDRSRSPKKSLEDPVDAARDVIRQLLSYRSQAALPSAAAHEHRAYQEAIQRVVSQLPQQAARVEAHFFIARRELEALLAASRDERAALVDASNGGLHSAILVDLLVHRSRRLMVWDLDEAQDLAWRSRQVAENLIGSQPDSDVAWTALARAMAHVAQTLALRGWADEAEPMLDQALEIFDRRGTGDVLVEAEVLELTGMLRIRQGRLEEAEALISMACSLYEECEAFERIGPTLAEKAATLAAVGEISDAIDALEESLAQLELEHPPELVVWAWQNHVYFLLLARLPVDAAEVLDAMPMAPPGPATAWLEARRAWLEVELARQRGQRPEGEETLHRALARLAPANRLDTSPTQLGLGLHWNGEELPPR